MPTERGFDERRTQRKADVREVVVISRNADNTYEADDTRTGQRLRFSPSRPTDNYAAGQHVMTSTPDASRNIIGQGYVAISTSPEQSRAVARYARGALARYGSPVVSSLLPYPVRLPIGFATPREMVIRGFDLSQAPTYEHAGITDDSPPVITALSITCELVAADGMPPGLYDVVVHGKTFVDALDCYEVPEYVYLNGYVYYDFGGGFDYQAAVIAAVRVSDWTVARLEQGPVVPSTYPGCQPGFVRNGEALYAVLVTNANAVQIATGSIDPDVTSLTITANIGALVAASNMGPSAWTGSKLGLISTTGHRRLYTVDPAGTNLVQVADLSAYQSQRSAYYDGTYFWVATSGAEGPPSAVLRITAAGAILAVAGTASCNSIAHSGAYVYAMSNEGANELHKITAATAVLHTTLAMGAGNIPQFGIVVAGNLYVQMNLGGVSGLRKIDLATFTTTATLTFTGTTIWTDLGVRSAITVSRDGLSLYVLTRVATGDKVFVVNLAAFTADAGHAITGIAGIYEFGAAAIIAV